MIDLPEILWPQLRGPSSVQMAIDQARKVADLQAVTTQSWRRETDVALEEARRLTDAEAHRRNVADTKAGTYLTVVGVLTPILCSFAPTVTDAKASLALRIVSALLLIVAVVYLAAAGIWAFRTLRVATSYRVDTDDLVKMWSRPSPKAALVRQLLHAAYANRGPVNDKVSRIKMTDAFLVRAFITFAGLLIIQTGWKPISDVYAAMQPLKKAVSDTALPAAAPVSKPLVVIPPKLPAQRNAPPV